MPPWGVTCAPSHVEDEPSGSCRPLPQVPFHGQALLPGDLISLQHDRGPGALLRCPPALSFRALRLRTLFGQCLSLACPPLPAQLEAAPAGPACALRLRLPRSGSPLCWAWAPTRGCAAGALCEVRATVAMVVSRHNLTCSFDVLSPVAGLRAIYPPRRMAALTASPPVALPWCCRWTRAPTATC